MEEKDDLLNPEDFDDTSKEDSKEDEKKEKSNDEEKKEVSQDEESSEEEKDNEVAKKKAEEQKKKNAEYAKKRREQEEAERQKREAKIKEDTKREVELGIYKKNPYTNEPIKDEEDLEVFKVMKQLDDEGLNPVEDYPKRVAELARKRKQEEKAKAEKEQKDKEYFAKDIAEFKANYPDVNPVDLVKDEEFMKFSEGKSGRWTTTEIYEAYLKEKDMAEYKILKKEAEKKAKEQADKATKTPSTNHGKTPKTDDIDNMTPEEFKEYWKKKYHR